MTLGGAFIPWTDQDVITKLKNFKSVQVLMTPVQFAYTCPTMDCG